VVGDVPNGNDGDTKFSTRSGITAFDPVERVVCRERGEDTIGVVERVLEIFDQLNLGFRWIVASLFAIVRRFLALKFVEEGELGAGDVLHLFTKAACILELSCCRDVRILLLRHGLGEGEKIPFCELKCATNAFRNRLGNVIRPG
jgi:hypothetical protein